MAQVITEERVLLVKPWWVKVRIIFIGALLGLAWWILAVLLRNYVIEPIACRDLSTATACVDSFGVAGSVAAVVVAIIAIFVLIRTFQPRPIIIAASAAALLWTLGTYVNGLAWYEGLLWAIALYAVTYALFGLVARIARLWASVIVALLIVIVIRILLAQ